MSLIIPKLGLRARTSLAGRQKHKLSPEAFDVLDKLANARGVVITSVSLTVEAAHAVSDGRSRFGISIAPDIALEVFTHLSQLAAPTGEDHASE